MKITPVSGPVHAQAGDQSAFSPERRESAKRVLLGEAPLEQKPVETLKQAVQERNAIKMKTNYSTNRDDSSEELPQESATPNVSEGTEEEVTRPISPQLAELARQRRALQVRERELAEKLKAFEDKPQNSTWVDPTRIQSKPLEVLRELGVSYDKLTEDILAEQSGISPEMRALQEKVESLEKGFETKLSERDQQAETQVLAEMQRDADRLIEGSPEDFELIKGTNSQKKVTELIHRTWKTTGEVLDVQEAAKLLEDQLVQDSLKMTNFGKIRKQLAPEQTQTVQKFKTLTNRDTAQPITDRRSRAIAAMRGVLK